MDKLNPRSLLGVFILTIVMVGTWGAQAAAAPASAGSAGAKVAGMTSAAVVKGSVGAPAPRTFTLPVKARDTAPAPRATLGSTTVTLLADGFENGFGWQTDYFSDAYYATTWGLSSNRASSGAYSAYCAQNNNPNAPYHTYPNGMDGYMYRGPFNLTNSTSASLGFDLWLGSEYNYDWMSIYYSLNGTNFYEINGWSGQSNGWERKTNDVSSLCGQPQVWIAFGFSSDATTEGEGAYVDNVNLSETLAAPPDTTPPATTAFGADSLWHGSPVSVTLSASDNPGGSGVAATKYSLDGGPWTTGTQVLVSSEGVNTLSYYSVDNAGNTESTKACTIKVDMTPPTPTAYAASMHRHSWGNLRCSVSDITRAGVNVTCQIRNSHGRLLAPATHRGQPANTMLTFHVYSNDPKGTYWFYVSARDAAGNPGTRTAVARLVVK
jgi:hypothetical protein